MTQIPVINMVATGQNITRLRKQAGLSVANLQQIFGFTTVFNTNINNILVIS